MQTLKKRIAMVTAVVFLFPSLLLADTAAVSGNSQSIEERLKALEHEIQVLKRVQEVNKEISIKKDLETPVVVAGKDGFALKSREGDFTLKFKGLVQADGRYYGNDTTATGTNQYIIRRLRPSIEGTVFKHFDFKFLTDFAGSAAAVQDAFIDFKYWKAASLRAGKFKSPMSLEALQSDQNRLFVESSLVSNLVPNRDLGFDLHGDLLNERFSYDLAILNGATDGSSLDTDNHDDKDFVGRIFAVPFKDSSNDWISGLGGGLAISAGQSHGNATTSQLPSFRTSGQQTFFSYTAGVFSDGLRLRINPQAYWYKGPAGILAEWVVNKQDVRSSSTVTNKLKNYAWNVAGSYVVTGEDASYNGVIPRNNLDIKNKTWGALELVSRLNQLALDSDSFRAASTTASAESATAWAIGANWYLNKYLKLMTDFEQTLFNKGNAGGGDRKDENAFLTRFQLAF